MGWRSGAVTAAFGLVFLGACVASQPTPGASRDPAEEQEILDRLAAVEPAAAPFFTAGTQAMDEGRYEDARQGFGRVLALAPDFPDALRRLATIEVVLGDFEAALPHAERALALQPSPWNESALAFVLLGSDAPADHRRALDLARQARQEAPDDPSVLSILILAAATMEDLETLRSATPDLIEVAPQVPLGHYYAGVVAALDGQWETAYDELRRSQELGMPPEAVGQLLDQGVRTQALLRRWARGTAFVLVGWAAGLVALYFIGSLLSRATLAALARGASGAARPVQSGERLVRTAYRVVVALTSLYFYLSMPILVVLVVAVVAGATYFFLIVGAIPLQLLLFLVLGGLMSLFAVARSLILRRREVEPGRPLARLEAPRLWGLTDEVAERLQTGAIQAIYVVPDASIAVLEQGRPVARRRGGGRRSLVLGLGALAGMTRRQLQAIVAHEYGHFSHGDTAGGDLALRVQASIWALASGLAAGGQARWYNPAWLFVNVFYRIFLRITLGASRLQETLADRLAAMAYGAEAFGSGLRHIVRQNVTFAVLANAEIEGAREDGRPLRNLYELSAPAEQVGNLEARVEEAYNRPTSAYDSHPSPAERVTRLGKVQGDPERSGDSEAAGDLIPGLAALQREMTSLVEQRLGLPVGETRG